MEPNPDYVPAGPIRVLRRARVVLPDRLLVCDLSLDGHRIQALSAPGTARGAEIWDLGELRVWPGFIDGHTHGGWGVDFATATPEEIDRLVVDYGRAGVGLLLPTIYSRPIDELCDLLGRLATSCEKHTSLVGIHLEGPFVAPDRRGALPEEGVYPFDDDTMGRIVDAARGQLRVMTFAPEIIPPDRLTRIAGTGVRLSIGHTSATLVRTREALRTGAVQRATHLFNAMRPFHHRDPGPLPAIAGAKALRFEVICDGEHVDTELLGALFESYPDRAFAVSDTISLAGLGPANGEFAGRSIRSDGCRSTLEDGTLAGSVSPLPSQLLMLERELGLPPTTIARLGAANPAADLGLPRAGRIATGHRADLVIDDGDGRIIAALSGGERLGSEPDAPWLPDPIERV